VSGSGGAAPPPPVRIDDLAAPRFPAGYDEIVAAMAAMAPSCPLEAEALLDAAAGATGLDDFGDDRFREPLDVLTRALRTEAGLSPAGTVALHTQLVQLLVNRLRITDLVRRHPEIRDVPVTAPIVIAGLPRTGTTHLHNLMATDPALRSLPYWESVEPVLAAAEVPGPGEPDPRLARTEASLAVLNGALPHFVRMHEMTVDHAHEEIQLLAVDLSTMYFETLALMPSYRDWYRSTDQTPAYRTLRTCLQALTWLRGGRRWVLKSPQHLEQFGPLTAAFPDVTVVVTHRDPVAVTASMVTMLAYLARLHVDRPDPAAYGAYWATRLEDMLAACARDRDLLASERSIDVRFDDLMADERGTVGRIYALAGQPLDREARAAHDRYLASHRRDRHGRVLYDLADLGLDAGERGAALLPYRRRFGV
jgi:Sulfotransferase family